MKNKTMKILFLFLILAAVTAGAWQSGWAPVLKSTPATVRKLSTRSLSYLVKRIMPDDAEMYLKYSEGGTLDLNGDGIDDFVVIIPWLGCGLNAAGANAYFIVSDGANWRKESAVEGYGIGLDDLVKVGRKTYFRHSMFFSHFQASKHNHWVYQMFAFDKDGTMKCANEDFGKQFPAATIFYDKPKFKRVELSTADLKKIAEETKPESHRYVP